MKNSLILSSLLVLLIGLFVACGGEPTPVVIVFTATPTPPPPVTTVIASPTPTSAQPTTPPLSVATPTATATSPPPLSGWTASYGGPDNARANLDAHPASPLTPLWEWGALGNSPVALAAVGERLFVLSSGGPFCILDVATGAEQICHNIWPDEKPLSTTDGQIALVGDTVVISAIERYTEAGMAVESVRGLLTAFTLDGQPRWAWPVAPDVAGYGLAAVENMIVVALRFISKPSLVALDAASGQDLWRTMGHDLPQASDGVNLYTDLISALRLDTGERLWEAVQEEDLVLHLAYADGRLYASAFDSIAALDAASGRELWRTDWDAYPAEIAVAHGNVYAVPSVATQDIFRAAVVALDAVSGQPRWTLPPDQWAASRLVAAADSVVVLAQDRDVGEYLLILDAANGQIQQKVALKGGYDQDLVVSGGQVYILGETLQAYGSASGSGATPTALPSPPPTATPLPSGAQSITPATVQHLTMRQKATVGENVRDMDWSPDGRFLALSEEGTLHLYRADTLTPIALPHEIQAGELAFSPDGSLLAVSRIEGMIANRIDLWRTSDWSLVRTLEGHDYSMMDMAFSPDGSLLASASTDARLRLWDVGQGTLRHDIKATYQGTHPPMIFALAFSPDGQQVWVGLYNSTVQGWRVDDGSQIAAFQTRSSVTDLFAGTENRLWTLTSPAIDAWLADGTNLGTMTLDHGAGGGDMNGDGVLLAVFGSEGIEFWDLTRQRQAAWLEIGYVGGAVFSPDGSRLAVLGEGKNLEIWQPASGTAGEDAG